MELPKKITSLFIIAVQHLWARFDNSKGIAIDWWCHVPNFIQITYLNANCIY